MADAAVAVFGVVAVQELLGPGPGVVDVVEPVGHGQVVLDGLEQRLGERVVVADPRREYDARHRPAAGCRPARGRACCPVVGVQAGGDLVGGERGGEHVDDLAGVSVSSPPHPPPPGEDVHGQYSLYLSWVFGPRSSVMSHDHRSPGLRKRNHQNPDLRLRPARGDHTALPHSVNAADMSDALTEIGSAHATPGALGSRERPLTPPATCDPGPPNPGQPGRAPTGCRPAPRRRRRGRPRAGRRAPGRASRRRSRARRCGRSRWSRGRRRVRRRRRA